MQIPNGIHTIWSKNCYRSWLEGRKAEFKDFEPENAKFQNIPKLISSISVDEMNYWLSRFALEVKKCYGTDY